MFVCKKRTTGLQENSIARHHAHTCRAGKGGLGSAVVHLVGHQTTGLQQLGRDVRRRGGRAVEQVVVGPLAGAVHLDQRRRIADGHQLRDTHIFVRKIRCTPYRQGLGPHTRQNVAGRDGRQCIAVVDFVSSREARQCHILFGDDTHSPAHRTGQAVIGQIRCTRGLVIAVAQTDCHSFTLANVGVVVCAQGLAHGSAVRP